jgi:hypothetical protein
MLARGLPATVATDDQPVQASPAVAMVQMQSLIVIVIFTCCSGLVRKGHIAVPRRTRKQLEMRMGRPGYRIPGYFPWMGLPGDKLVPEG